MTPKLEQASKVTANEHLPGLMKYCDTLLKLTDGVKPEAKCFYSPDGSVFVGIPISETEDSFLVAAAARLSITKDKTINVDTMNSEPVMRLFKSSVRYTVNLAKVSTYHYYTFLQKVSYGMMPEYFTEERRKYIDKFVEDNCKQYLPILNSTNDPEDIRIEPEKIEGQSELSFHAFNPSESIH